MAMHYAACLAWFCDRVSASYLGHLELMYMEVLLLTTALPGTPNQLLLSGMDHRSKATGTALQSSGFISHTLWYVLPMPPANADATTSCIPFQTRTYGCTKILC